METKDRSLSVAVVTVPGPILRRQNDVRVAPDDRYLPCGLRRSFVDARAAAFLSLEIH